MLEVLETTKLATLTRKDVAKRLNISYSTIVRWEEDRNNPIPHARKGAVVRFNGKEVDDWWDKHKTKKVYYNA